MKILDNNIVDSSLRHKDEMIHKRINFIIIMLICLCLTGCNKAKDNNNDKKIGNITTESASPIISNPAIKAPQNAKMVDNTTSTSNEVEVTKGVPDIEDVNYGNCFDGIDGCAVFFNSNTNLYKIYNAELCEKRTSPCSTFKIISTIMGLEKGIITSVDSKMGYDGTVYTTDTWNKDLGLREAFNESCIWYFRKVIDQIGQSDVQKYLNKLKYGNCDISEWDGSGINSLPELNGFWLESSLEISPKEQVNILADIFNGKTDFSKQNIEILKEVMLTQKIGNVTVYGKTGTGQNADTRNKDNGWFVGMIDNSDDVYYFAVHLTDENQEVSGPKAKEIALNIINQYYVEK